MKGHIEIPKPCHENWMNMSAQEQGRHCGVCCKTVIDFTAMPTEKVIEVLSAKASEKICGRFREDQLGKNKIVAPRNRYRVFMAALYFVFGGLLFSSCRTHQNDTKMGKVKMENGFTADEPNKHMIDTPFSREKNKICRIGPTENTPKPAVDTIEPQIRMLGEVMYIPPDTTK